MVTKHYNIDYLKDTNQILKNLKEYSYRPFTTINNGTIIDLGCGMGQDVINMAGILDDGVKIVGIDHDPEMLDQVKLSNKKKPNIDFICSEANKIPFGDEAISGIRSERLVQHLVNPEKMFLEIYRVLKKDHPLLIVETDWLSLSFYNEYVPIEKKINNYLIEEKVNNGLASRNLISYLEKCNFRDIRLEVFPFVLKTLKEANDYFWIERILKEVWDKKHISENEYELFKNALHKADENNYFACSINIVIVSSIK